MSRGPLNDLGAKDAGAAGAVCVRRVFLTCRDKLAHDNCMYGRTKEVLVS